MTMFWHFILSFLYICECAASKICQNISIEHADISAYNKLQVDTVNIVTNIGPQLCVKECRLHQDCKKIVYSNTELTCVLLANVNTAGSWDLIQTNIGACTNHTCGVRTRCVVLKKGEHTCIPMDLKEGAIVLQDGSSPAEGRVEIYYDGQWGTINGNTGWSTSNAKVACRQLSQYSYGVPVMSSFFGQGTGPTWLQDVDCVGTEEVLADCPRSDWGPYSSTDRAVGVICSNTTFDTGMKVPIRLSGGRRCSDGVLEMLYAGYWGTLAAYSSYFGKYEADVVCRQLNYSGGNAINTSYYSGYQRYLVWRAKPDCHGSESYFSDCDFLDAWGEYSSYMSYDDIAVVCEDPDRNTENDTVRLVDGDTAYRGRIEVLHAEFWGTVSVDDWDDLDAVVVCRELGYSNGFAVSSTFGVGTSELLVWVSDVSCNGTEQRLVDCPSGGWNTKLNSHSYDAGVICSLQELNTTTEGTLRLVGGTTEGRVEIYIHGLWSSICDALWNYKASVVVCRQLGYTEGAHFVDGESGTGYILVDGYSCNGDEDHLLNCTKVYAVSDTCDHDRDIGVVCTSNTTHSTDDGELRLQGGQTAMEGRVEVYHAGRWGTIWDDNLWSDDNALVVCTQLGFSGGRALHASFFGPDNGPVWMSNVQCSGSETRLDTCMFGGWGVQTLFPTLSTNSYQFGIGVVCFGMDNNTDSDMYGNIRLVGVNSTTEGRIEIYGPTGYGTVKSFYMSSAELTVVCRQLGLRSYGDGTGTVWLYKVGCVGTEQRLEQCKLSGWGQYVSSLRDDTGVVCVP